MTKSVLIQVILSIWVISSCQVGEKPQTIPEFSMKLPNSSMFHSKDIPNGKTAMIVWFDPNCRECQEETEYILANMHEFQHTNIYLITRHPHDELMVFYDHLRLDTCKNIKVGIDTAAIIPKQYHIRSTPLTLVFDNKRTLRAVFTGKPKPAELLEVVQNNL